VADKPLRWRVQDKISHLWWLQSNTDLGIKFTKVKWLMHCLDIDIPQTDLRTCLFHDESAKTTTIFKWQGKWHPWLLCVLLRPSESAALWTREIRSPDTQRNRNSFMISAVTEEELGCTPPHRFSWHSCHPSVHRSYGNGWNGQTSAMLGDLHLKQPPTLVKPTKGILLIFKH
jgi:hypothetical protein